MYEVTYSPEAKGDITGILDYVADHSRINHAYSYVSRMEAAVDRLCMFPHRGAPRDDLAPGLRAMSFEGRAVIVYRVDETTVRIFPAGRDVEAELADP